nr:putative tripartite motif-containing protein 75 [Cavia porcellus]
MSVVVSEALMRLQAETKCPVCLDDLNDPVTIECGHNFCRACIRQSWADLQEKFPCPVCRFECEECYYRSNAQLGRMVQIARQLSTSRKRRRPEKTNVCEKHGQVLTLFCEEDLEVLCPECMQPPDHSGHRTSPLGEAAARHRVRLHNYAKLLRRQALDTQQLISAQSRAPLELREKAQTRRQRLACEVELLNRFLEREQQAAFQRLAEEEQQIRQKLSDNIKAFTGYKATLQDLLARVEGTARSRARQAGQRQPVCWAPRFYSGRHFWQVEVGDVPQWAVGVCRALMSPKGRRVGQGCWCLQLQDGGYEAPGATRAALPQDLRDRTLGLFLDYELGELSIYDMPEGAHICTFSDTFTESLRPYFYIGPDAKQLKVLREPYFE